MLAQAASVVGVLAAACLLGGMVFFGAVMAPLVFTRLDAATSGRFIRATFPRYYLYVLAAAALGAAGLAPTDLPAAAILAVVAASTAWLRWSVMPRINALRDAELAGDAASAPRFARLHRMSVALNGVQLLAVLVVMVRVALDL